MGGEGRGGEGRGGEGRGGEGRGGEGRGGEGRGGEGRGGEGRGGRGGEGRGGKGKGKGGFTKTIQLVLLQWNPSIVDTLGPGDVSCIERCPHFRDKLRGVSLYTHVPAEAAAELTPLTAQCIHVLIGNMPSTHKFRGHPHFP